MCSDVRLSLCFFYLNVSFSFTVNCSFVFTYLETTTGQVSVALCGCIQDLNTAVGIRETTCQVNVACFRCDKQHSYAPTHYLINSLIIVGHCLHFS